MIEFPASLQGGTWYRTVQDYLQKSSPANQGEFLCDVIEAVNSPLRHIKPGEGLPWMSVVLGSGCASEHSVAERRRLASLPSAVALAFNDHPPLPDERNTPKGELAASFLATLIQDRACEALAGDADSSADRDTTPIDPLIPILALAGALLARCYFGALSQEPRVERSRSRSHVVIDPMVDPSLAFGALEPLKDLLDLDSIQGIGAIVDGRARGLREPLTRMHERAVRRVVELDDVHLLAEALWHQVTLANVTDYPGWGDLVLRLSTRDGAPDLRDHRPRPRLDHVSQAAEAVRQRLQEPTLRSWDERMNNAHLERLEFFSAVADFLAAQAAYRAACREPTDPNMRQLPRIEQPPIASAFVASFDVELEMALLRLGSPFVVALPVHLVHGSAPKDTARTCWLGCVVDPQNEVDDQLSLLLRPQQSRWFQLSNRPYYSIDSPADVLPKHADLAGLPAQLGDLPVVVRLNGCPLIDLPGIVDTEGQLTRVGRDVLRELLMPDSVDSKDVSLYHAALVVEYDALQQTALEMFEMHDRDIRLRRRPGLPREITGLARSTTSFARFWAVLGVPIGESHVRLRVTSQVAPPRIPAARRERVELPLQNGVIVNKSLADKRDGDLFYWLGFDVVADDCRRLTLDLKRLAAHLREPLRRRPHSRGKCELCLSIAQTGVGGGKE